MGVFKLAFAADRSRDSVNDIFFQFALKSALLPRTEQNGDMLASKGQIARVAQNL